MGGVDTLGRLWKSSLLTVGCFVSTPVAVAEARARFAADSKKYRKKEIKE